MHDDFDDQQCEELFDESDCPASDYDWDDEPDIDEAQEWADLPYGYDDDPGYYDIEDSWDF
jgi:hypothetical protein